MCFMHGGIRIQGGFSATHRARILAIFQITDVNQCPAGESHEKFPNFCTGSFAGAKTHFFEVFVWGACN